MTRLGKQLEECAEQAKGIQDDLAKYSSWVGKPKSMTPKVAETLCEHLEWLIQELNHAANTFSAVFGEAKK